MSGYAQKYVNKLIITALKEYIQYNTVIHSFSYFFTIYILSLSMQQFSGLRDTQPLKKIASTKKAPLSDIVKCLDTIFFYNPTKE